MAKNKAKKVSKKKTEGILDKVKLPDNTIRAGFSLYTLKLDKTLKWTMELLIAKILPKSYKSYSGKMVFNEQPYFDRMASVEKEIRDIEADAQLFRDMQSGEVEVKNKQLVMIQNEMADKKKECPEIEIYFEVEEIKYKNNQTLLKVGIPDTVIAQLNEKKFFFSYYQVELKPVEENANA